MNSKQRIILAITTVLIVFTVIVWLTGGSEIFTKTKVLVDKTTYVEKMLGVKYEAWEDKFIFGLLPSGMSLTFESFSVATSTAVILFAATILFFIFKTKKTKETK